MKLSARDAQGFFQKPDPKVPAVLIYGEDAMRVALKRQELIANLVGPAAEEEMRLTRIPGAELVKDGAQLLDAIKAVGFFPGPRVAFVEAAQDRAAPAIVSAIAEWAPGDAQIVVTAGALKKTSALRKAFEPHPKALVAALYNDPMGRAEIEAELARAGLCDISRDSMSALEDLARSLPPGDFRQTLEKIALYKLGDSAPLTPEEVALSAPATVESEIDEIFHVVAEGRSADIGPVMQRLLSQGVTPVTFLIMAMRHFRALYAVAAAPGGPAQGIAKLRPPIFGPRRDKMLRQAQGWGAHRLEDALHTLMEADLTLRSAGQRAPAHALVERVFVRLAYMASRR